MMGQKIKKMDFSQINYTPMEGEIMQNAIDGHYYIWHEDKWNPIKMDNSGFEMGLYDMNKQIIAQLPDLTEFKDATAAINKLYESRPDHFYMMYGKEISYFTLFEVIEPQYLAAEVIYCLKNVGSIKAIDLTEAADAIEIWVMSDDEPTCLYLFPYDNGVVKVGE